MAAGLGEGEEKRRAIALGKRAMKQMASGVFTWAWFGLSGY